MRQQGLDRPLIVAALLLATFGVLMVYSSGQTDVPSFARNVWIRQLAWIGMAIIGAAIVFRFNFRILEWAAPFLYTLGLVLLVATLVVGTGTGTAAGTKSWLAIGGQKIGQPVELAKLGTILFLARYLSSRRDPPQTLRALFVPAAIAGAPLVLVMGQPDLGSAIVFVSRVPLPSRSIVTL